MEHTEDESSLVNHPDTHKITVREPIPDPHNDKAVLEYLDYLLSEVDEGPSLVTPIGHSVDISALELETTSEEEDGFFDPGFDERVFKRVMALITAETPTKVAELDAVSSQAVNSKGGADRPHGRAAESLPLTAEEDLEQGGSQSYKARNRCHPLTGLTLGLV